MTVFTDKEMRTLKKCFVLGKGKAWEPPSGTKTEFFAKCVSAGYLQIVDGRCGFELIKDAMVTWTEAGKIAIQTLIDRDPVSPQ